MENVTYQKLKDYALKLLSIRPRSKEEIRGKLLWFSIKRGISAKLVEKLTEELVSHNFLNDEEFAIWWVEQRRSFRPKGQRAIRFELQGKKVDKEIIDKVLKRNKGETGEFELAQKLVGKKLSLYKNETPEIKKRKITSLLLRRGFDWEIVKKVIDSLLKKA